MTGLLLLVFATPDERDTFDYLYTHYRGLMMQKAYGILHDRMLAEDAVSEAFIRIYKNMGKLDDPASNRSLAFVMTIVRNTALTMLQKQMRRPVPLEEQEEWADPLDLEQQVLSALTEQDILSLVDSLGEDLRSVFLLKYAYEYSNKQIAKLLGITANNVTVRLYRARQKLATRLAKEGYAVEKET